MSNQQASGGGSFTTDMPTTTAFEFVDWPTTHTIGACYGLVVRSLGVGRNVVANLQAFVGGEVKQYTALLEDSRRHAVERLVDNARLLGGNAIIGVRFDSSEIGQGLTEVVAYGTAVVVEK